MPLMPDQIGQALQIRRLGDADIEVYRGIRLATLANEPDFFGSVHDVEAALPIAHFAARLASACVLGAFFGDRVVGVVDFRRGSGKDAHKGEVRGFYVEREQRGRGIASALLLALTDIARTEVEQLTLTVVQGNAAAMGLYQRFGFTAYGVEPRARKTAAGYQDMVMMVRFLQPA